MDPNLSGADPAPAPPTPEEPAPSPQVEVTPAPTLTDVTPEPEMPSTPPPPVAQAPTPLAEKVFEPASPATEAAPPSPTIPSPKPAVPPHREAPTGPLIFGIVVIVILILSTVGAFLYLQNRGLQNQLNTLQSIESQRALPTATPTPTTVMEEEKVATGGAFLYLPVVLPVARAESATAQLLMVSADVTVNAQISDPALYDSGSFQYWFRRGAGQTQYFQVILGPGTDPQIVKPAVVSPDNNIPDLIEFYTNNTLGLDTFPANALAWNNVVKAYAGTNKPISITAKYLRAVPSTPGVPQTPVNLWQFTYKFDPASGLVDTVVQLDATTKQILFTNAPSPTPTNGNTPS